MNGLKPLTEQTIDRLIQYIQDQNLQKGTKLPNEYALCDILGVGRSTIREAAKALVARNILEVRQGAGTFVAEENIGVSDDPLGLTFIKDKHKLILDLMEIRMAIEPRIAALAAVNATEEDVAQLTQLCKQVESRIRAHQNHMDADIALHCKIAESSKNVVAPNLMPIIQQALSLFIDSASHELRLEIIAAHRQIIDAISSRDAIAASDTMTLHLVYNRNHFLNSQP